jgi:hypothetical protein
MFQACTRRENPQKRVLCVRVAHIHVFSRARVYARVCVHISLFSLTSECSWTGTSTSGLYSALAACAVFDWGKQRGEDGPPVERRAPTPPLQLQIPSEDPFIPVAAGMAFMERVDARSDAYEVKREAR